MAVMRCDICFRRTWSVRTTLCQKCVDLADEYDTLHPDEVKVDGSWAYSPEFGWHDPKHGAR